MGLYKQQPLPSGRMGALWTLGTIKGAVVLEFGSMGHMIYARRWFEQAGYHEEDVKLYVTHLDEKDIALGITDRIGRALDEILAEYRAEAVFLIPSSVPEVIGIDMEAIREELSYQYEELPILFFPCGSFSYNYHKGIETALYELLKHLPVKVDKTEELTCNIIGSCIDLHLFEQDAREIERIVKEAFGMKVSCVLSTKADVKSIQSMGAAQVNLVIRSEGKKGAEILKKRFGTPYLLGRPYGYKGTLRWIKQLEELTGLTADHKFIGEELREGRRVFENIEHMLEYFGDRAVFHAGGNADVVQGLRDFACGELSIKEGIFWCDSKEYEQDNLPFKTENDLQELLEDMRTGILMARKEVQKKVQGNTSELFTERSINEWNFNPHTPPYVGFRGALNLCARWFEEIQ